MISKRFSSKTIVAASIALVLIALTSTIGVQSVLAAKNFAHAIKSSQSEEELIKSARNLENNVNRLITISNLPLVSHVLKIAGLEFSPITKELDSAIQVSPYIFGSSKPLRYLISFQNSAEARGTGGILGAYAIVEIANGNIKVIKTGSNASLYSISLKTIPVDVPEEFLKLYGQNPAILQNSNLSPHFPYGAEIWMGLWKEKFGEQLDGVIAIDPIALSYILRSTGEIILPTGEKITAGNVVEETLKNAYKKYESNNDARKQYLVELLNSAVTKLQKGEYSKLALAKALKQSIIENRLLIYSQNSKVESILSSTRLSGFMSTSPNNEYRAVIQNIDASKLDYYLDREVTIKRASCEKSATTQVKLKVTNTLVSGKDLPAYVLTRADKSKPANLVTGSHRFKTFIYGPPGSKLVSVSRENRTVKLGGASAERNRPIYVADVDLGPGESEELLANFSGGTGKISYVDQPLVRTTKIEISDNC